jgi:hypothetical protein
MADRIHGRYGQVLMDLGGSPGSPVGGSPYAPVAVGDVRSYTLSMKTDRVEVTAFGDTNKRRVAGLPDYSGNLSFWYNSTGDTLTIASAILAGTPVFLRLVPDSREASIYFEGLANLDGELSVDVGGAVSFNGTWDAAGSWTLTS